VNLFNGGLNFQLPLMNISGRGGAGYKMTLPIEQKWRVSVIMHPAWIAYYDGGGPPLPPPTVPEFIYMPVANWWSGIKPGYGPGVMQGRFAQFGEQDCPDSSTRAYQTLTRLTFAAPDGTEFELRDQTTGGAPASVAICAAAGQSRGTVFVSADGSAATFISDTSISDDIYPNGGNDLFYPTGYLLLRDGSRYRIANGVIDWMRDRNGNRISFSYDSYKRVTHITDSLNRQISITYCSETNYDEIVYKGFEGAQRSIKVYYSPLENVLRSGFSTQTYQQLFPELNGSFAASYNPSVVSAVVLPNNKQYQFQYNSYGELARVILPTGGATEYDYAAGITGDNASGSTASGYEGSYVVYRRVIERRIYPEGGSSYKSRMTYSRPEDWLGNNQNYVMVDQRDASDLLLARSTHYFHGSARLSFAASPIDYSVWKSGREYQTDTYDTNGTIVLTSVSNSFAQRAAVSWLTGSPENAPPNDPRVTETVTTIEPGGANLVSKQTFGYDDTVPFNNQNNVKEYAFGSGAPGALVRETRTTFVTASSYVDATTGAHLRSLASQVSICNASGVERARAVTEFDNYTPDGGNHASLTSRTSISGLDSAFTTSYVLRGNATAATSYLLDTSGEVTGSITTYAHYDVAGNMVKAIDGRGNPTSIFYDDCFGGPDGNATINSAPTELSSVCQSSYAFATSVSNALNQVSYAQFEYYLGQPVDGKDVNGIVASGFYDDPLGRPTKVVRANNQDVSLKSQTAFSYDDTNHVITTTTDQDSFNDPTPLKSQIVYDGLGRTTEKRQFENATDFIAVRQTYDGLGRSYQTSNPFRATESILWTTTGYDAVSRVISVTTPDSAVVSTSYSGNTVTVTDQAGRQRKSVTDALGRLKEVYEDPGGLNYLTSYGYDVLDNLTTVNQGSQTRTFVYDSLKRLTSANNPESGTVSYQYDNNGNLTLKTDARGVQASYTYDALNRNTSIIYSNDPMNTPRVNRYYDGSIRGIGRLTWEETVGVFAKVVDIYDVMGQPTHYHQRFWVSGDSGPNFIGYVSYDKAGHVTTLTYPSGHTVTNTYDGAGRLASFTGNLGDATQRTYSTGVSYSSFGGMTQEQFGTTTPIYNKRHHNVRGQLYDVRVSSLPWATDQWDWNRGCLINFYATADLTAPSNEARANSGPDNNGNLIRQMHWVPADASYSNYWYTDESYSHDSLNRLQSVSELHGGPWGQSGTDFQQAYSYDRWGNRTVNQVNTWGTNISKPNFGVDTSTNQLTAPIGYSMNYDPAGNLTNDTYTGQGAREYNAENKMTRAWSNGQWQTYTYDGSGQRIKRNVNGTETWQVYGLGGELLAEYAANAAPSSPQKEYGYRNGELLVTAEAPTGGARTNFALAANGGVASASSTYYSSPWLFTAAGANNGVRSGAGWGSGEGWNDSTGGAFPDWVQIDFNGSQTIDEIDVFTGQDNYANPSEPTETMTFSLYGLTGFDVQYWDGSSWVTVPGGAITSNNKVWKKVTFSAITTTKIRVLTNASVDGYSRITEVEAWTAASGGGTAQLHWLVTDQLGTPRMVFDQSGSLANVSRHDYLPFGEEVPANFRTGVGGYATGDSVRQKFTQKERDNEAGLDYFEARYYGSTQGRFTSVDPLMASGRPSLPQSWNRYAYVLNSPLRLVDPTGLGDENINEQKKDQTSQQPASPPTAQPATPTASPPVDSSLAGSPLFVQQNPIPIGITYTYSPVQTLVNQHQTYADGVTSRDRVTGVIMNVAISVVSAEGPITDFTLQEVVTPDPGQNLPYTQNPNPTSPVTQNGIVPDTIGPLRVASGTTPQEQQALNSYLSVPRTINVTQELYIAVPNRGVVLYGINRAGFSNVDANGRVGQVQIHDRPVSTTSNVVGRP
jgi:RHS repeat-associated protein